MTQAAITLSRMTTSDFPAPPTMEDAARYLDEARGIASAGLVIAVQRIVEAVTDPNPPNPLTNRQVMDISEHLYKVSGMAAKQAQAAQPSGPGFSVTINIPGREAITVTTSTLPADTPAINGEFDIVLQPAAPTRSALFPITEDLVADDD